MHSETCQTPEEIEAFASVKRLKPKEFILQEARELVVPEDTTIHLSPASREFTYAFARVTVASFEDAQIMGFIPRKLAEDKIMKAIASDDALAYKIATGGMRRGCDCGHDEQSSARTMRGAYTQARKRNNPALAELIAEKTAMQIAWDSSVAASVRKWALTARTVREIVAALFSDITINRNATLSVAASAKSLWAHDIWIHRTGKLVQTGSYLRIWANSLNQFNNVIDAVVAVQLKKLASPWLLQD